MARIGYARVSSYDQNLDRQIEKLKQSNVEKIFSDKQSGENAKRPGLIKMMNFIREGDTVVAPELDRLGRDNQDLTNIIYSIQQKGATVEGLNIPSMSGIEDENLRKLITNIVIEIYKYQAENERIKIKANQREGIQIAKKKGVYTGRKPLFQSEDDPRLQHAFSLYRNGLTLSEVAQLTGINKETFRRYVKKYNIQRTLQEE